MTGLPNFLAVILAAVSGFAVGGIWYSKYGFAKQWMEETGLTEEKCRQADRKRVFGGALALNLLSALVLALYLKTSHTFMDAVGLGFAAGSCWAAASLGVNYLFEGRSLRLFLINGGYITVQFTVMGLILGLLL